jgi:anti-sigma B factor antagonist
MRSDDSAREDRSALGEARPAFRDELRPRGPVELGIAQHDDETRCVLILAGELDILTATRFGTRVEAVVRQQTGDVVVDLRKLRFIDSAGLHILLNAQRRLTRRGRRFTVLCHPGPVARAMELARLSETLGVELSPR